MNDATAQQFDRTIIRRLKIAQRWLRATVSLRKQELEPFLRNEHLLTVGENPQEIHWVDTKA